MVKKKFHVGVNNIWRDLKLTVFYRNIVCSTALVVREKCVQFAIAADWVGGITETQVTALTAMMMWLLHVQLSIAANLVDKQYLHMHTHTRESNHITIRPTKTVKLRYYNTTCVSQSVKWEKKPFTFWRLLLLVFWAELSKKNYESFTVIQVLNTKLWWSYYILLFHSGCDKWYSFNCLFIVDNTVCLSVYVQR